MAKREARQASVALPGFQLPLLGSNQDSSDPEAQARLGLTYNKR